MSDPSQEDWQPYSAFDASKKLDIPKVFSDTSSAELRFTRYCGPWSDLAAIDSQLQLRFGVLNLLHTLLGTGPGTSISRMRQANTKLDGGMR